MTIPVKPEPVLIFGQIARFAEVESEWGMYVHVYVTPADPNATSERDLRMKWSKHRNSPLQKFFRSFDRALVRLIPGSSLIANDQQCVGAYVRISEIPQEAVRDGNYIEWNEYQIDELYETKEVFDTAWKAHVATLTAGIRKEAPPPPEPATPEPLPASIIIEFKKQYEKLGKNADALLAIAEAWGYGESKGYSKEFILAAVQ